MDRAPDFFPQRAHIVLCSGCQATVVRDGFDVGPPTCLACRLHADANVVKPRMTPFVAYAVCSVTRDRLGHPQHVSLATALHGEPLYAHRTDAEEALRQQQKARSASSRATEYRIRHVDAVAVGDHVYAFMEPVTTLMVAGKKHL